MPIGSAYSDLLPLCLKVQHLGPTEYREEVSSPEDERPIHSSVALIRSDKGSSYLLRWLSLPTSVHWGFVVLQARAPATTSTTSWSLWDRSCQEVIKTLSARKSLCPVAMITIAHAWGDSVGKSRLETLLKWIMHQLHGFYRWQGASRQIAAKTIREILSNTKPSPQRWRCLVGRCRNRWPL